MRPPANVHQIAVSHRMGRHITARHGWVKTRHLGYFGDMKPSLLAVFVILASCRDASAPPVGDGPVSCKSDKDCNAPPWAHAERARRSPRVFARQWCRVEVGSQSRRLAGDRPHPPTTQTPLPATRRGMTARAGLVRTTSANFSNLIRRLRATHRWRNAFSVSDLDVKPTPHATQ